MFERLKPKMSELGDLMNAMDGILESMDTRAREQIGAAGGDDQSSAGQDASAGPVLERNPRLVGHWRFTDAMSSGGGFSQATDYHRVLEADGGFVDSNHTCGSFGERWSDPESGRWRTDGQILCLEYNDGSERTYEYHLENDTLFFPGAQHQRLWERVG